MSESSTTSLPPDDPERHVVHARPDEDPSLPHVGLVGDTYTILVAGDDTDDRYCLIDMHVPPGGGPPPHRHDFEELFSIVEGQVEFTFRGERLVVKAGESVNIPANAPHAFRNTADHPARLLCFCSPAGADEFFLAVGDRVDGRTAPPPDLGDAGRAAFVEKAKSLAPKYRTEILLP
jgi:mannose-6-phosphate isomerase-like protein (cupin superfamily)